MGSEDWRAVPPGSDWIEVWPSVWIRCVPETVDTQTPPWVMEEFRALDAIEALREQERARRSMASMTENDER